MNRRGISLSLACTLIPLGIGIAVATPPWAGWAILGPVAGAFLTGGGTAFALMTLVKDPTSPAPTANPAPQEADPVLQLRERVRTDYNHFAEHFAPYVRGKRLEAELQWLETQLQDRIPHARELIQQVRAQPIRTAATEFYNTWADLVAYYDEAVDHARYAKQQQTTATTPTPEEMWSHAQASLETFLAIADSPIHIDREPA